jgi:hypothetical protein
MVRIVSTHGASPNRAPPPPKRIDLRLRRGQRFALERGQTSGERIDKRVEIVGTTLPQGR